MRVTPIFFLLLFIRKCVFSTKKELPLWDLNKPALEEAEERQYSPTSPPNQSPRLEDGGISYKSHDNPQTNSDSECEIHNGSCRHWKKLTKKEKISAKNKRFRKNAVSLKGFPFWRIKQTFNLPSSYFVLFVLLKTEQRTIRMNS